jgi:hypothetical protein
MAKLATLSTDIAKSNPDIIAISETWLHSNIADSEISINTYTIFRKDRTIQCLFFNAGHRDLHDKNFGSC